MPPNLPSLEILYAQNFRLEAKVEPLCTGNIPTLFPRHIPVQSMLPSFASGLLGSPRLRIVRSSRISNQYDYLGQFKQMDKLEASRDGIIGHIRSIRHGDNEELLHARLLLNFTLLKDAVVGSDRLPYDRSAHHYTTDGVDRIRTFTELPAQAWQDFTYYRGQVVPLDIIEKMMRTEGAKEGDWDKRGIEVKAETWKVLDDWIAGLGEAGARP